MKKGLLLILLFSLTPFLLFGDVEVELKKTAGTRAALLRLPIGCRAIGMGGAFCSVGEDVTTLYWNPAGLAFLQKGEVYFAHYSLAGGVNYEFISGSFPFHQGNLGLSLSVVNWGEQEERDRWGVKKGTFTPYALINTFGYAQRLKLFQKSFSTGLNIKMGQENLPGKLNNTFCLDAGVIYEVNRNWKIGAVLQNFWFTPSPEYPLPINFKIGTSQIWERGPHGFLSAFDLNIPLDSSIKANFGLEYRYRQFIFLRAGLRMGYDMGNWSVGLGTRYKDFSFSYAFLPRAKKDVKIGTSHRFSLLWHLKKR
jgi:hypothetical protein